MSFVIRLLPVVAVTFFLVDCCCGSLANAGEQTSTAMHQKFSVSGATIIDEAGNEKVFRGVNIMDPVILYFSHHDPSSHYEPYLVWDEEIFRQIAEWGGEIVRLPIHPGAWRRHGEDGCKRAIDEAIAWAEKYGLYVIIDFHSIGFIETNEFEQDAEENEYSPLYDTTKEELLAFWDFISRTYSGNNVVSFYDIFNEPVYPGFTQGGSYSSSPAAWNDWATFAEEVVQSIRRNDPDTLIMVGGLHWSYDLQQAISRPVAGVNIVYSAHIYPGGGAGDSWEQSVFALKQQAPVFVSEIGFQRDPQPPYDIALYPGDYRAAIKNGLESRNMSWTAWVFSPAIGIALLADKEFTPTEAGDFFRAWLEEKRGR